MGLCVVGGLIFAQFVTLYFTPVFYTYMDNFLKWRKKAKAPGLARDLDALHPPLPSPLLDPQLKRLGQK